MFEVAEDCWGKSFGARFTGFEGLFVLRDEVDLVVFGAEASVIEVSGCDGCVIGSFSIDFGAAGSEAVLAV